MGTPSATSLLAIHGLRLKGFATTDTVANLYRLDLGDTEAALSEAATRDEVRFRTGARTGWALTPMGRTRGEADLAAELEATGGREEVYSLYRRFLRLNQPMLVACSRWQLVGDHELNDHADPTYDASVIDELAEIDAAIQPIANGLAAALDRFGIHGPRFAAALERLRAGQTDWFTGPLVESYHTVWFELHEDLLATLGLDRASERQTTP